MGNYAKGARFHEVDKSDVGELFQPYVKSLTNEDLSGLTVKKLKGMASLCTFKRESLKYQFFFLENISEVLRSICENDIS